VRLRRQPRAQTRCSDGVPVLPRQRACGDPRQKRVAIDAVVPSPRRRRAVPRMSRSDRVTLLASWQTPVRAAQLRNLSMTGVSIITDVKIERQQVIRVIGPLFDILATVVGCRSNGRRVEVHAGVLSAIFTKHKGVVVSVKT
jgi:hypothetical protein